MVSVPVVDLTTSFRDDLAEQVPQHCALLFSRAQKYLAPVAGTVPTNVPTMYPWQGKMGENGGKWRKMGKMGENGGK